MFIGYVVGLVILNLIKKASFDQLTLNLITTIPLSSLQRPCSFAQCLFVRSL